MIFLFGSILFSSLIYIIFKKSSLVGVFPIPLIIINYWVAGVCSLVAYQTSNTPEILGDYWLIHACILGSLFVIFFRVMALTTIHFGVSTAAIASKMSLIIPVLFAVFIGASSFSVIKGIGVILALTSVYLTSIKPTAKGASQKSITLPIILFLGCGCLDTYLKWTEEHLLHNANSYLFIASLFISAGVFGVLFFFNHLKNVNWKKTLVWSSILGVVNYFSIYTLLLAFTYITDSSLVFPINNTGIVLLSTVLGLLIFREQLNRKNMVGVGLAIAAISLLYFYG